MQVGPRGKERSRDPGPRGADAPPLTRFCPSDSGEEAPGERSADAEDAEPPEAPGGRPPDEACVPPAHALVLGGFGKSKAPRVSERPGGGTAAAEAAGLSVQQVFVARSWEGGVGVSRSPPQARHPPLSCVLPLFIFIGLNPEQIVFLL